MKINYYFVYIMTNYSNSTLYIGVTNDLYRRVFEHKQREVSSFSQKNYLNKLVYYEQLVDAQVAIDREKQLKRWHRDWKLNLIRQTNPELDDLSQSVLGINLEDAETSSA